MSIRHPPAGYGSRSRFSGGSLDSVRRRAVFGSPWCPHLDHAPVRHGRKLRVVFRGPRTENPTEEVFKTPVSGAPLLVDAPRNGSPQ